MRPICLPSKKVGKFGGYGELATGWGFTGDGEGRHGEGSSDDLKEAYMKTLFHPICMILYGYVDWDYICAGVRTGRDAAGTGSICVGDYGSGLVSKRKGRYELDGVSSIIS